MKKVYGIGVGPGDKELITLKAHRLMGSCDYIFVPRSKGDSFAKTIAEDYISGKKIIELDFPMGEDNSNRYVEAAYKINEMLKDYETGVFLTIGDPMTYSTYMYLMFELQKLSVEVETIPGITSFSAAFCRLNMPLTLKEESFYLCDGEIDEEVLKRIDSICILKVIKNKENILNILEKHGFKYAYIRRCTGENEKVLYNKEEIMGDKDYMSLILARR